MSEVAELNARFGIAGQVVFKESNGVTVVEVNNDHGTATIALQGAHLISWTPTGQQPVVWVSPEAKPTPGKSIRGGIPVCWPWFGAHASEAGYPAHGYVRTMPWAVTHIEALADGGHRLNFRFIDNDTSRTQWPHPCELELVLTLGASLEAELITRNTGNEAFTIGEALHTYFQVSDVREITIDGLDGVSYLDKVDDFACKQQTGAITIGSEVDRVYLATAHDCVINDPTLGRRIRIAKRGSQSTVVWNPWIEKADKMGDLGPNGYLRMVCVESANAVSDVVEVAAGAEHRLWVEYSCEAF